MSSRHPTSTASERSYARAYALHYTQHDLLGALHAYEQVIEHHPTAPEAEYSRSQMRNIVHRTVPAPELLASQVALVRRHLQSAVEDPNGSVPS
jgi:hypothetical protein